MAIPHHPSINGKKAGPVGYGLLGLTIPWAPLDYAEAVKLLKTALENGANVWNGSTHYGTPEANSTQLMKYYFEQYPEDAEKVILTMKGAYDPKSGPDGSPEGIRASVEAAYRVLQGIKTIDVFAMARVDPRVPIEISVQALATLVEEGKIGGIGLSEVGADTIRIASKIHPIASAEIELSLFTPDAIKSGILAACKETEHDCGGENQADITDAIQVIAYSPIGRGWLTDVSMKDLPKDDYRRRLPRFMPEAVEQNSDIVKAVSAIAQRKGCSTAQVALSWVVAQSAIPIPGSKDAGRITQNCAVVELSTDELTDLQSIVDTMPVSGQRYGGEHEKLLNA